MRDGLGPAAGGVALGLAGGAAATGSLRRMLVGVQPFDAATFAAVAALMLAAATVACFLPARRATTVSPVDTLRAPGG